MNCQETSRPNLWKKVFGTVVRVSSRFETFIEWTQDAALLYLIQKRKVRGLLGLQLICPVVARISCMGQNNAVCYLMSLQSLVLFVEEIQKRIGHRSSKRFTLLLEFWTSRWLQWASDTHACVVVSKLHDVTNMEAKETRAHFTRVSSGEILWKFVYFML